MRPKGRRFGQKPIPVKLEQALLERLDKLAERIQEPRSTVMRMAMRIGIESLEKAFEADPKKILGIVYPPIKDEGSNLNEASSSARRKILDLVKQAAEEKKTPPPK